MMNRYLFSIPLLIALIFVYLSVYTVGQAQIAIKFRLGEKVETVDSPGLYFQIPLINNVKKFDKRLLTLESKPERFLTSEKKNVIVDYFAKWEIENVGKYYTTVAGDVGQANIRLDQIVKDAMRGEFSQSTIKEVVSSRRGDIRAKVLKAVQPVAKDMGINIKDIRVMRIDLPSEVSSSVYRRMEAEQASVASYHRSQGAARAEQIRAEAERQRDVTLGEAYRDAELKRGEGDASAAEIYAQAYGKDKEFYAFYRSLSAYKEAFDTAGSSIVLEPNSEFFQYFNKSK